MELHWRSSEKLIQEISNYYQTESRLKVLCLRHVSQSSKSFAHWLSKISCYFKVLKRKGNSPWTSANKTPKPFLVHCVLKKKKKENHHMGESLAPSLWGPVYTQHFPLPDNAVEQHFLKRKYTCSIKQILWVSPRYMQYGDCLSFSPCENSLLRVCCCASLFACIPVLDPPIAQMKLALRGLVTYELKQEPGRVVVHVWVNVSWLRRWEWEWAGNPPFSTLPTSESFSQ